MLDLDRFKAMNDTYGHLMGDQCLTRLAEIILQNVREKDLVARMGGDEFALLLRDLPQEAVAVTIAGKLAQAVTAMGGELGMELPTSVSIGVATAPLHGRDFESLYRHADAAMYEAKADPDTQVVVYGQ